MSIVAALLGTGGMEFRQFDAYWDALQVPTMAAVVVRLPADPIGSATLALSNLVVGSAVEIEDSSIGTSLYSDTASATTLDISLNVYPAGSTKNTVRVKVRKGSASPYYQPWETLATLVVGSQPIYVSQIPDE